jgi:hypothetical protein
MECFKSLDPLLEYDSVFGVDTHFNDNICLDKRFMEFCKAKHNIFLGQYAFGAKQNDEFIKILIDNIHNNINYILLEYNKLTDKKDQLYVYTTTGPDYVSKLYYEYPNNKQIKVLDYPKEQFFGEYAEHKWMGTWK